MTAPHDSDPRPTLRPRHLQAAEIRDERWCRERTLRWLDRPAREYAIRIGALQPCPRWRCRCHLVAA